MAGLKRARRGPLSPTKILFGVSTATCKLPRIDEQAPPPALNANLRQLEGGLTLVFWAQLILIFDLWLGRGVRLDLVNDIVGAFMFVAGVEKIRTALQPSPAGAAMTWATVGAWALVLQAFLDHAAPRPDQPTAAFALVLAGGAGEAALCWGLARIVAALGWSSLAGDFRFCGWVVLVFHGAATGLAVVLSPAPADFAAGLLIFGLLVGAIIVLYELSLLHGAAAGCRRAVGVASAAAEVVADKG